MKRLILALLIASVLGLGLAACVSVPLDAPDIQSRAATGSITGVSAVIGGGFGNSGCTISTAGALSCDGAAIISNTLRVSSTLTLSGTQISGPVRYGLATGAIVSGTTIAHGVGTTPTMALLTASLPITTPLFVSATGPVSITVGISDSVSTSGVYWLAGQ